MKTAPSTKRLRQICVFSLFGAIMYLSAQIDIIPNVHQLSLFILVLTCVYRAKALIPIYLYVFLEGLMGGFNLWWYPYLYIWAVMWLFAMAIPRNVSKRNFVLLCVFACSLHGILFGILYSPSECYAMFGGDWSMTYSWIIAGLPFDIIHCVSNGLHALLALPLINVLQKIDK